MDCDPNRPVTRSELSQLEQHLDQVWDALGVDIVFTRHFFDRLNDPRNVKQITVCELQQIFRDTFREHGSKIVNLAKGHSDLDGVIRSATTNIYTPFVLQWNGDEFELIAKTIMRKRGFKVPGGQKQFKVEGRKMPMGPFEQQVEQHLNEYREEDVVDQQFSNIAVSLNKAETALETIFSQNRGTPKGDAALKLLQNIKKVRDSRMLSPVEYVPLIRKLKG